MYVAPNSRFPVTTAPDGDRSQVRASIQCYKCEHVGYKHTYVPLPDAKIEQHFKSRGWTVSRTGRHDICPRCNGVTHQNALADRFRVTGANGPIPARTDVRAQAELHRDAERAKTSALIERHFPQTPQPDVTPETDIARPAPEASESAPSPASTGNLEQIAHDISEMRIAFELNMEETARMRAQQERLIEQNRENNEQQRRMIAQHQESISTQHQAITAVTRLAETTAKQNNAMSDNMSGVTVLLRELIHNQVALQEQIQQLIRSSQPGAPIPASIAIPALPPEPPAEPELALPAPDTPASEKPAPLPERKVSPDSPPGLKRSFSPGRYRFSRGIDEALARKRAETPAPLPTALPASITECKRGRGHSTPPEKVARIKELAAQGLSYKAIARQVDVGVSTAHRYGSVPSSTAHQAA